MDDINYTNEEKNKEMISDCTKKKSVFKWKYIHKDAVYKEKREVVIPKYTKKSLIISAVFFLLYVFVKILKECGYCLYLFRVGSDEINYILIFVCSTSFLYALSVFFYKNSDHKIIVVIIMVVVFIVHLWFWSISLFLMCSSYHQFVSPDKENTIVVQNDGSVSLFPISCSGDIYEKTSFCTMKKVGHFYIPSNCGSYYFVWNDEDFEMHFSCETEHEHEPITIAYVK